MTKLFSTLLSFLVVLAFSFSGKTQHKHPPETINFDDYFINKTLRIDYTIAGNSETRFVSLEQLVEEGAWSGPRKNISNSLKYGLMQYKLYDSISNKLIYSKGFNNLFVEWETSDEAKKINRSFYEVATCPFPKKTVKFILQRRNKQDGTFEDLMSIYVNPNDYFIKRNTTLKFPFKKIIDVGNSAEKIDIVYLAEGYTKEQMGKFQQDVKRMNDYLFERAPFKSQKSAFNIWAIECASQEQGTDIPGAHVWGNTILNSSFYTFNSARYLTTFDQKSIRDIASNVPYDHIVILVNHDKYGGGGFFNYYLMTTVDHIKSKEVFVHEFGHSFAGLADEYFSSSVAVNDFYPASVEPWEPNITNMVNFDSKWKHMIAKEIPIPTPLTNKYKEALGAFEGAGYSAKGLWRPMDHCIMRSLHVKQVFCPVCQEGIKTVISSYMDQ
ncbi:MAG: peptidase [Flavobacteriaceae bacterium]|nr:peptidase [Flavobacteriaceae bacterium]